jgi:multisubunit Na+/H+ antiporter MnhB subunit
MLSSRSLSALAASAITAGIIAAVFHGHKPLADVAFVAMLVFGVALVVALATRIARR